MSAWQQSVRGIDCHTCSAAGLLISVAFHMIISGSTDRGLGFIVGKNWISFLLFLQKKIFWYQVLAKPINVALKKICNVIIYSTVSIVLKANLPINFP